MSAQNYTPVDVKVDLLEAKLRASTTRVQQLHAEKLAMEARVAAMEQVMAVQEAQLFVRAAGASGGDAEDRDKVHQLLMT